MLVLTALLTSASAHHPHDPVDVVDLSPAFATDRTLVSSRVPCQNWRPNEIMVSRDGGYTWWSSYRGMANSARIVELDLSPTFDADGIGFVTTAGDGAYLTMDGAESWSSVLPGLELGLGAVTTDGSGTLVLLAHEVGGALWRSDDLGATWSEVLFPGNVYTMAAHGPEIVVGEGTLVRTSQDAGLTWDLTDLGVEIRDVAAAEGARLVGTTAGAYLSTSVGVYEPLGAATGAPTTEVTAVGLSPDWPADPLLLVAEIVEGPYVSEDGGQSFTLRPTWVPLSPQDPLHFYGFRLSPNFGSDQTVLLNTWEGLIVSSDRGQTWTEIDTRTPGLICGIGVSPLHDVDETVLLGTFDAGMLHSTDRGDTFEIHNKGIRKSSIYDVDMALDGTGVPVAMMSLRDNSGWGTAPFDTWELRPFSDQYASRSALHPLFATSQLALQGHRSYGILRSDNGGIAWTDVFPGNTKPVTGLAWSVDGTTALFGDQIGAIYVSIDLGQTWTLNPTLTPVGEPVSVAAGPDGFLIGTGTGLYTTPDGGTLTADPLLTGTVHMVAAAADGTRFVAMRGDDFYRSDPGGGAWTAVGLELAEHGMPHELVVSPTFATDGTVYAAVDDWLYRSTDRGDTFAIVGPTVVRYEEDAAPFKTLSGPRLDTITFPEASVDRMAILPPGEEVSLTFAGTGVSWVGTRGGGVADVELDGAVVATIDTAGTPVAQETLFEDLTLPDGVHTLKLIHVSGDVVSLDALDIHRPLPSAPPITTPGETGDTGEGTPPVVDTTDTGPAGTTDGTTPPTDLPKDEAGGGCGCASTSDAVPWLALVGLMALARRRETL